MDWTLILLIVLLGILIYMNYKKSIDKLHKKNNMTKTKKVSWSLEKNESRLIHHNPTVDFFDDSSNMNGIIVETKPTNSQIIKYLNKQDESYGVKVKSINPTKAGVAEDPSVIDDINNYTAHEIIGLEDPNSRVNNFRENPDSIAYCGETIGELYDNMVDNYRVKWGKFDTLGSFDRSSHYGIDVEPSTNGYTNFATY
jgi:hypothetical protein